MASHGERLEELDSLLDEDAVSLRELRQATLSRLRSAQARV